MTHIVENAKMTKREFIALVKQNPSEVFLMDPSIVNPKSGTVDEIVTDEPIYVTNHPRRSWFAKIKKTSSGVHVS